MLATSAESKAAWRCASQRFPPHSKNNDVMKPAPRYGLKALLWMMALPLGSALACRSATADPPERTAIALEALSRLQGIDLDANPGVKAAVMKALDQVRGTPRFVEIVRDFKIRDRDPALLFRCLT